MFLKKINGPRVVALPDGRTMTRADLPEADSPRWVTRRKRAVAEAVQAGLISRTDAKTRYALSDFELDAWCCQYPLQTANRAAICERSVA
jgi:hypothetical protein